MIDLRTALGFVEGGEVIAYPIMLSLQVEIFEYLTGSGQKPAPAQFRIDGADFATKRHKLLSRLLRCYSPQLEARLKAG